MEAVMPLTILLNQSIDGVNLLFVTHAQAIATSNVPN